MAELGKPLALGIVLLALTLATVGFVAVRVVWRCHVVAMWRKRARERLAGRFVAGADIEIGEGAVRAELRGGARQGLEKVTQEQPVGGRYAIGMRRHPAFKHIDVATRQAAAQMIVRASVAEADEMVALAIDLRRLVVDWLAESRPDLAP